MTDSLTSSSWDGYKTIARKILRGSANHPRHIAEELDGLIDWDFGESSERVAFDDIQRRLAIDDGSQGNRIHALRKCRITVQEPLRHVGQINTARGDRQIKWRGGRNSSLLNIFDK